MVDRLVAVAWTGCEMFSTIASIKASMMFGFSAEKNATDDSGFSGTLKGE